jgi:serralysin
MAIVHGTGGSEVINASDGVTSSGDLIFGHGGGDSIYALGGNDIIYLGDGSDYVDGGLGRDTVSYVSSKAGVQVNLQTGTGARGNADGDRYVSIENVDGSPYNDHVIGNGGENWIDGLGGNDLIDGGDGEDELGGSEGNDLLKGGGGDDGLKGGADNDVLRGGDGQDFLSGGDGDDYLYGEAGVDDMTGGQGADTFVWLSTDDTGPTMGTADYLYYFEAAEDDRIHLGSIDADIYAAGNQAFTFIGTAAFSGAPGEVNYTHVDGETHIQLQTGTSADVEGIIRIAGIYTPDASWFML